MAKSKEGRTGHNVSKKSFEAFLDCIARQIAKKWLREQREHEQRQSQQIQDQKTSDHDGSVGLTK